MTDIGFLTIANIKNNLRMRISGMISVAVILICVAGVAAAFSLITISPSMKSPSPDRAQMEMFLAIVLITTNFMGLGINLNVYAFQTLTREKSRGVIQSLLATPLGEKQIWAGKSLAIFLPGLILGEILTLLVWLALNLIFFVPKIGWLISPWMALTSFAAVPLMYLGLTFLVYLVGLTGKPATGNVIAQIFLPGFITLFINLVLRSVLDVTSWSFTLIILGIGVIFGIIILFLRSRLAKERIVLSG